MTGFLKELGRFDLGIDVGASNSSELSLGSLVFY